MESSRQRRQAGFAIGKLLVWSSIGFAIYSGWCFLPTQWRPSHLETSIESVLEQLEHTATDRVIRERTWKAANVMSVDLERKQIQISREKLSGERVVNIRFQMPVTIEWLGNEKVFMRDIDVTHRYLVNEGAESARLARIEENERTRARGDRFARAQAAEYASQIREECAKGGEAFVTTGVFVTFSDGSSQNVSCSQVSQW